MLNVESVNSNSKNKKMLKTILIFLFVLVIFFSALAQFEDDQIDLNEAWFTEDMYNSTYFVDISKKKYGIIAPGTKWCGQGTKAENYTELGRFNKTDMCCRAHDNCPVVIFAGESIYNLTNPDKSSRLSCDCDKEFYNCLKAIRDIVSKTIGTIYFDILQKKCLIIKNGDYKWQDNEAYSESKFIAFLQKFFN